MQITHLNDAQELAGFLEQSTLLTHYDHGAMRVYVVEFAGQDLIAIADGEGRATVVYPPEAFDAESGGSVHDHARAIYGATPTDGSAA